MVYGQTKFGAAAQSTVTIIPSKGLDLTPSTYAYTELADFGLGRARTISSFFRMKSENGRGGSAITLARPNIDYFDALVWAEREPRKWMAGSTYFARTTDLVSTGGGDLEEKAYNGAQHIMMTIVYSEDGTIQLYRNGNLYGDSYEYILCSYFCFQGRCRQRCIFSRLQSYFLI